MFGRKNCPCTKRTVYVHACARVSPNVCVCLRCICVCTCLMRMHLDTLNTCTCVCIAFSKLLQLVVCVCVCMYTCTSLYSLYMYVTSFSPFSSCSPFTISLMLVYYTHIFHVGGIYIQYMYILMRSGHRGSF